MNKSKKLILKKFPFSLNSSSCKSNILGLITLETDLTIEKELNFFLSKDDISYKRSKELFSLLHTRISCEDEVNEEHLKEMEKNFSNALSYFPPNCKFNIVGYGCTSASVIIGEEKIEKIIKKYVRTNHVTNPITSIKNALKKLNSKKIGFLAPYKENITLKICNYLISHGFDVIEAVTFNESRDSVVCNISSQSILDSVEKLYNLNEEIDTIIVCCTSLNCAPIIEKAEKLFNINLISSNSAIAWEMAKKSNLKISFKGKGNLYLH